MLVKITKPSLINKIKSRLSVVVIDKLNLSWLTWYNKCNILNVYKLTFSINICLQYILSENSSIFFGAGEGQFRQLFLFFLWFIPCNKYWRMSLTNLIRASDCNCLQLLTTKFVLSKLIINNIPKILLNRYNFFNEISFFVILKILTNLI